VKTPYSAQSRITTPLGPMTLAATHQGLAGVWFDDQAHHPGPLTAPHLANDRFLQAAAAEIAEYFAGLRQHFEVPLDPQGTAFQQAVWRLLRAIPCGALQHYGDIARQLDKPDAARAVGAAVGRNPISLIVPCHRVVGRNGALTGYAGGLPRKEALLRLEGAAPLPAARAAHARKASAPATRATPHANRAS
jgi:methylated-DNA-[protein]-cysteine S-methyltransferase